MKLKMILKNLDGLKGIEGKTSLEIKGLACDSKAVRDGFLFVAVRGSRFNGADFIDEAIDRGAKAIILESDNRKVRTFKKGSTFIYADDVRRALSQSSMAFYGDLSSKMRLIGVTGTNGKTTTAYLLERLFNNIGEETGVIGTINYRFGGRLIPAVNTTPGVLELSSFLSSMHNRGIKNSIIEVSSHSLEQGRVDTLGFDIAVFTNLTSEHLDFHKDIKSYLSSKMKLFSKIKQGGYAVINKDDASSGDIIKHLTSEKKARVLTYGISDTADVRAKDIRFSFQGLKFKLCHKECIDIRSKLIGRYNVYNILASASCGIAMGMSMKDIARAVEEVPLLQGRLEKIDCGQDFLVFVDYAHTENGLESVLKALRELGPERLIVVFGCGGDRDKSKRPKMGRVSSELSDKMFITSDNPRNEDPMGIIDGIKSGIPAKNNNYTIEPDRFRAIDLALKEARRGDIVLVAGKGHETYQIFKNTTLPFDDREVVKRILSSSS